MIKFICLVVIASFFFSCTENMKPFLLDTDKSELVYMIQAREKAMIHHDLNTIVKQFDTNAIFINGNGFYFDGIKEISAFHNSMFLNDSLTYTYKIGTTTIRPITENVVVIYYPWQQNWTLKNIQSDTLREIGLMTIVATKNANAWKWNSITNQRTKDFFEDVSKHKYTDIR
jgi:hypothetical protein